MFAVCTAYAQPNMVPNGNFEDTLECPTSLSQIHFSKGWRTYTSTSPDYFHRCHPTLGYIGVPSNFKGFQNAASRDAYVGMFIHTVTDFKEYVTRSIVPLTKGATYEVSLSASLSDLSTVGTNDLGVYFYLNADTSVGIHQTLQVTPQVSFTSYGPITDTSGWVRLKGVFYADSAYSNIVIGGFIESGKQKLDTIVPGIINNNAYYYIDSVVVRQIDLFTIDYRNTALCAGDTIDVDYYATNSYQSNNVFTIQLSDPSGSFNNPVDIGSHTSDTTGVITCVIPVTTTHGTGYRMRVVSSNAPDTTVNNGVDIKIGNVRDVTAGNNSPVCLNEILNLTANTNYPGHSYSWTGPGGFSSNAQNPVINTPVLGSAGDYTLSASIYGCTESVVTTVEILNGNRPQNVVAKSNSPICEGEVLSLVGNATGASLVYSWSGPDGFGTDNKEEKRIGLLSAGGKYVFTAGNGECIQGDTIEVIVNDAPDTPVISSNSPLYPGDRLELVLKNPTSNADILWTGPLNYKATLPRGFYTEVSAANSGRYYLTTTLNGCSFTDSLDVLVYDIKDTNSFVLYPNHNNGTFYIEGYVFDDAVIPIDVIAMSGQRVHSQELQPQNKWLFANIVLEGRLHTGRYFVRLYVDGELISIPMTVVRE